MARQPDIGQTFADYEIEAVIGRGGMAVVYRAQEKHPSRTVALKLLDPDLAEDEQFRQRFLRESDLAAHINHPNIIPVFDSGESEGILFIAMPLIEGADLATLIRRERRLGPGRTSAIIEQAARALDAAHDQGLIHRDVKPANVLVVPPAQPGDPDHVYLADFGLARRTATSLRLTRHEFLGTREYCAPEQIRGEELDGRADVYALGCVLYECLTGSLPFEADSESALIYAHLEREPPKVTEQQPELPAALDAVVAKAMAKDRDERYRSCRELAAGLRSALGLAPLDYGTSRAQAATVIDSPAGVTEVEAGAAGGGAGATELDTAGAAPSGRGGGGGLRDRRVLIGAIAAVIALPLIGFGVAKLARGGGGGGVKTVTKQKPPGPPTTAFTSDSLGLSFRYPASWHEKQTETPEDSAAVGDDADTCIAVVTKDVVPPGDEQARRDLAQERIDQAKKKYEAYDLIRIQDERAGDLRGIGFLRTYTDKGQPGAGHIAFFWARGNEYVVECRVDPARLEQEDKQVFQNVIASFRPAPGG